MRVSITIFLLFNFFLSFCQLASWNNGSFKELDKKSVNNLNMWTEGNGQLNYEEISRVQTPNGDFEVILNDLNGRSGMQVRLTNGFSYWKYSKDQNWIQLYTGTWSVIPSLNSFISVKIGKQTWMSGNLNVDRFRNGDPIPEAKSDEEWRIATNTRQPAWCYVYNDPKNVEKYGKLYNWYAVNDPRGLAPKGWKVASDEDWKNLIEFSGGSSIAGSKMKASSGSKGNFFAGELAGFRNGTGPFADFGVFGDWWCSSEIDANNAIYYKLGLNSISADRNVNDKPGGLSVRCIEEVSIVPVKIAEPVPPSINNELKEENCEVARNKYLEQNQDVKNARIDPWAHYLNYGKKEGRKWPNCTDNNIQGQQPIKNVNTPITTTEKPKTTTTQTQSNNFKSVQIGTQIWMTENLNVDRFRNGDPIPEARTMEQWQNAGKNKQPAWCYYDFDPSNGVKYGKLYNSFAAFDQRGLAPIGWHIPLQEDYERLTEDLGGMELAGKKMKSTSGWNSFKRDVYCQKCINWNAEYRSKTACHDCQDRRVIGSEMVSGNGTNSSGFSGCPGGQLFESKFRDIGKVGIWFINGIENKSHLIYPSEGAFLIHYNFGFIQLSGFDNDDVNFRSGFSMRCVKD